MSLRRKIAVTGLEPSALELFCARKFLQAKWLERAVEKGMPVPETLDGACKFASIFAQSLFGGELQGHKEHQYLLHNDVKIDLVAENGVGGADCWNDADFFWNPEHRDSLKSCLDRVTEWKMEYDGGMRHAVLFPAEWREQLCTGSEISLYGSAFRQHQGVFSVFRGHGGLPIAGENDLKSLAGAFYASLRIEPEKHHPCQDEITVETARMNDQFPQDKTLSFWRDTGALLARCWRKQTVLHSWSHNDGTLWVSSEGKFSLQMPGGNSKKISRDAAYAWGERCALPPQSLAFPEPMEYLPQSHGGRMSR